MSTDDFSSMVADNMFASLEKSIEGDLFETFSDTPKGGKDLDIFDLVSPCPKRQWRYNPDACRSDDIQKGRGTLLLNPAVPGVRDFNGGITTYHDVEYRILVDDSLRGCLDDQGRDVFGYWVDPVPRFVPVVPTPTFNRDDELHLRCKHFDTVPMTMGIGIDAVDLGPVPLDIVAAKLPRATALQQTKVLKSRWKMIGKPISLKAYAKQSKWGRAWLERKNK